MDGDDDDDDDDDDGYSFEVENDDDDDGYSVEVENDDDCENNLFSDLSKVETFEARLHPEPQLEIETQHQRHSLNPQFIFITFLYFHPVSANSHKRS